jgi:hypothetical protein
MSQEATPSPITPEGFDLAVRQAERAGRAESKRSDNVLRGLVMEARAITKVLPRRDLATLIDFLADAVEGGLDRDDFYMARIRRLEEDAGLPPSVSWTKHGVATAFAPATGEAAKA